MLPESSENKPAPLFLAFRIIVSLFSLLGIVSIFLHGKKIIFLPLLCLACALSRLRAELFFPLLFGLLLVSQVSFEKRLYVADPVFELFLLVMMSSLVWRLRNRGSEDEPLLLSYYLLSLGSLLLLGVQHWRELVHMRSLPDLFFNGGLPVFDTNFSPIIQALRPFLSLTEAVTVYFAAKEFRVQTDRELPRALLLLLLSILVYGTAHFALVDNSQFYNGIRRAESIFSGPNVYGGFLVLLAPLVLAFGLSYRSAVWRLIGLASFLLLIANLYFSKSAGAGIGALASMIFFLFCRLSKRKQVGLSFAAALGLLVLVGISLLEPWEPVWLNALTHGRYFIWRAAFAMTEQHPIIGLGLGQFSSQLETYYPLLGPVVERKTHAHNWFVQVLAEQGVPTLFVLLAFFVSAFRRMDLRSNFWVQVLMSAVFGSLVHSLTDYTNLVCVLLCLFFFFLGLAQSELVADFAAKKPSMCSNGLRVLLLCLFVFPSSALADDWQGNLRKALKNGGAYAVDESGHVLFAAREKEGFIPASTLKVATIFAALDQLGGEYRFPTEFFSLPDGSLLVKGYGDPLLISEELEQIAAFVAPSLKSVKDIVLDDSFFAEDLSLDGVEGSSNPYDAQNGALIANFNTVYLKRLANGTLVSGEPQTPLVPLASTARTLKKGSEERFNLGFDRRLAARYFGELLEAFLKQKGVKVSGTVKRGVLPPGAKLIYNHLCPKTLYELSQHILEYSTNFGANQIFLVLGAKKFGAPATYEKGSKVVSAFLSDRLGLKDFRIVEGSGLSRRNLITAQELVKLIKAFRPHEGLLPLKEGFFHAKTGSLTGVNSLAGYMDVPEKGRVTFAFIVNSVVPFRYKYSLADELYRGLNGGKKRN